MLDLLTPVGDAGGVETEVLVHPIPILPPIQGLSQVVACLPQLVPGWYVLNDLVPQGKGCWTCPVLRQHLRGRQVDVGDEVSVDGPSRDVEDVGIGPLQRSERKHMKNHKAQKGSDPI